MSGDNKTRIRGNSRNLTVCLLISAIPLAILIYMLVVYSVDIPFWDEWELTHFLDASFKGVLTFGNLWAQHNEHRILFPKIILLVIARLTGWNIYYEEGFNVLVGMGIFSVLAAQIIKTSKTIKRPGLVWAIPIVSLIVFSLAQDFNYIYGWQVSLLLGTLTSIACIVQLSNPVFKWWRFISAILICLVGTYSFAGAIVCWPIGAGLLLMSRERDKRRLSLAIWLAVGIVAIAAYMHGYQRPIGSPPLLSGIAHPLAFLNYFFTYLGAIAGYTEVSAAITGLLCLAAIPLLIRHIVKQRFAVMGDMLPYIGIALYSLMNGMITAMGRVGFGNAQALSARYITISFPLWVCVVVLLMIVASRQVDEVTKKRQEPQRANKSVVIPLCVLLVTFLIASNSGRGVEYFIESHWFLNVGRNHILNIFSDPDINPDDSILERLYPDPKAVLNFSKILHDRHISLFRESGQ